MDLPVPSITVLAAVSRAVIKPWHMATKPEVHQIVANELSRLAERAEADEWYYRVAIQDPGIRDSLFSLSCLEFSDRILQRDNSLLQQELDYETAGGAEFVAPKIEEKLELTPSAKLTVQDSFDHVSFRLALESDTSLEACHNYPLAVRTTLLRERLKHENNLRYESLMWNRLRKLQLKTLVALKRRNRP